MNRFDAIVCAIAQGTAHLAKTNFYTPEQWAMHVVTYAQALEVALVKQGQSPDATLTDSSDTHGLA